MSLARIPGRVAMARHGWWTAQCFLVLRRIVQAAVLLLFLTGPWFGVWIIKGTLASSLTLGVIPLTDPLILLQGLFARHWPEASAFTGAGIVLALYLTLGGRTYCSWVCPVNPIADLAGWLRRRLAIDKGWSMRPSTRWWVLAMILAASAATGAIAWELVNPVTTLWRAIVFGPGLGLLAVAAVFLFDLLAVRNGWCGHLCPVGAFYGLVGKAALLRVSARGRARCDDCLDCFVVCPESHVIAPALRGTASPVILSGDCTACARCIDVCPERVFVLTHRFDARVEPGATEVSPGAPARAPVPERV